MTLDYFAERYSNEKEKNDKIDLDYEKFPSEKYYKICELLEINIEY